MPSSSLKLGCSAAAVLFLAFGGSGCVDYMNRYDGVTLSAGDAMYANAAIQTIDPWPPSSRKTTIPYLGRKTALTTQAYTSRPAEPSPATVIDVNN